MKVLSLKEPFASLIKEGIKSIETRSWKTNYRGYLYIHASLSKIKHDVKIDKLINLLSNKDFNYGYIIVKCKLVDCIYMDDEFIKLMKNNETEYLCGIYEIGRYAWLLEDIEVLDKPIRAKGQLSIWNYK
jgi:hypothetical protein